MEIDLKKIAHGIVMENTLYGNPDYPIGSNARATYEAELRSVLLGMQKGIEIAEQLFFETKINRAVLNNVFDEMFENPTAKISNFLK